jgi:hypothetical protein
VFIEMSVDTCMSICVCVVFLKKINWITCIVALLVLFRLHEKTENVHFPSSMVQHPGRGDTSHRRPPSCPGDENRARQRQKLDVDTQTQQPAASCTCLRAAA